MCDLYGELTSLHAFGTLNSCIELACLISVMHELWLDFGWLGIICETLWIVMWLRTKACGYLCDDLCL
jgi:hypothetical protein